MSDGVLWKGENRKKSDKGKLSFINIVCLNLMYKMKIIMNNVLWYIMRTILRNFQWYTRCILKKKGVSSKCHSNQHMFNIKPFRVTNLTQIMQVPIKTLKQFGALIAGRGETPLGCSGKSIL